MLIGSLTRCEDGMFEQEIGGKMILDNEGIFYKRELPHYQPIDATYAVMFRIAGSLPGQIIETLRLERDEFLKQLSGKNGENRKRALQKFYVERLMKFDHLLDHSSEGPWWLKQPRIARIVAGAIHYWDQKAYELLAYCIMPNHVHMILSTGAASQSALPDFPLKGPTPYHLTNILTSIKKYSAIRANRLLKQSGAFWQDESYDHVVRDGNELKRTIWYVLDNPVRAGMVDYWRDWRWSYVKDGLIDGG